MRNTAENRAAYWKDSRTFLYRYAAGIVIGALLFRWSLHETNEVIRDAMFFVPGLIFLGSGFVGAATCEIYFMLKGFDGDWYAPEDSFPSWFNAAKAFSFLGMIILVGTFLWLVATA